MQAVESYTVGSLDRREVLRYMGYRGQEYDPSLDERIDAGIGRALEISQPRGVVRTFDIAGREAAADGTPAVQLAGTSLTLEGKSIAHHLEGAVAAGVFAVTLSMSNERELKRLSLAGSSLDHVIFDAASTTLVERAADAAEASAIATAEARGLYTNFRFSPGYGDLPMTTQPVLLRALDAQRLLGITLSPSYLMTPTKSVTAIVGMFPTIQKSTHKDCHQCPCRDFCSVRAAGRTCHDQH